MQTPDTYADLFWAYTFIWVILSLYIISLGFRLNKLEKQKSDQE